MLCWRLASSPWIKLHLWLKKVDLAEKMWKSDDLKIFKFKILHFVKRTWKIFNEARNLQHVESFSNFLAPCFHEILPKIVKVWIVDGYPKIRIIFWNWYTYPLIRTWGFSTKYFEQFENKNRRQEISKAQSKEKEYKGPKEEITSKN